MKSLLSVIALVGGVLYGLLPACHARPVPPDGQTLKLLSGATRVEVYRINTPGPRPIQPQLIDGYPITSRGKTQGVNFAHRLAVLVRDQQVYKSGDKCKFSPGVAFRAWHGDDYADVLICFHCDDVVVFDRRLPGRPAYGHSYAVRPQFVRLAKEAFPGDKEIQSLPERR